MVTTTHRCVSQLNVTITAAVRLEEGGDRFLSRAYTIKRCDHWRISVEDWLNRDASWRLIDGKGEVSRGEKQWRRSVCEISADQCVDIYRYVRHIHRRSPRSLLLSDVSSSSFEPRMSTRADCLGWWGIASDRYSSINRTWRSLAAHNWHDRFELARLSSVERRDEITTPTDWRADRCELEVSRGNFLTSKSWKVWIVVYGFYCWRLNWVHWDQVHNSISAKACSMIWSI